MRLQYTSCEERLRLLPRRDFGSRLKIKIFLIKLYNLIIICFDAFFFSFFFNNEFIMYSLFEKTVGVY